MQITTVMVVILIVWCLLTLLERGGALPPAPMPAQPALLGRRARLAEGHVWPTFTAVAIFVGFGHSILAMSGEESLAQVYREIEQPKVKNLQRAGHGHLRLQPALHRARELLRRRRSFPTRCGRSSTTT